MQLVELPGEGALSKPSENAAQNWKNHPLGLVENKTRSIPHSVSFHLLVSIVAMELW